MSKRNNAIEFYRFLFSQIIVLFHFFRTAPLMPLPFTSGNLAVEMFLLLGGFFLAQHTHMQEGRQPESILNENLKYACGRFFRLYPHYLLSVLGVGLLQVFVFGAVELKKWIKGGFIEILMMQSIAQDDFLNPIFWFPSALFTASFVVHILMLWKPRLCTRFLFPVIAPGILASLIHANGGIFVVQTYNFFFSASFWRALAEMMLGCICYDIVHANRRDGQEKSHPVLCAVAELVLLCVLICLFFQPQFSDKGILVLLLSMVFIILVFSQESLLSKMLNTKVSGFLGKISYAVYLNQAFLLTIMVEYFPFLEGSPFWLMAGGFMLANTLFSCATTVVAEKVGAWMQKMFARLFTAIGKT